LFVAFRNAPPVEANLLNYLWPLLIVLLAPLLLPGTRLTRRHLLAAATGFVGAMLVVSKGHAGFDSSYLGGYGAAAFA
ncbi:EamA family transporter, partial [Klebsiella pneumoniae]